MDLARIAGLEPAGVICEIMNEDGTMARVPELTKFAKKHGLPMITIADLIQYRMRTERLVKRAAVATLPTEHGAFQIYAYESQLDGQTHVALVRGEIGDGQRRPCSRALEVPHRRCLPLGSLRLRSPARDGDGADCQGRPRRPAVPESGGPRYRIWPTRSGRTSSRTRGSTRSKPTSVSASRPTSATTASARRS